MKVSILISSYNKGKYIKECVESCLIQDDKNFEVILFDNYSNDETDKVLYNFRDKIKIFKSKKISNYPALNQIDLLQKAFEISNGEIICLLDADDYFKKEKIKKVRDFFQENRFIDVLFDLPLVKQNEVFEKFKQKKDFLGIYGKQLYQQALFQLEENFLMSVLKMIYLKIITYLK